MKYISLEVTDSNLSRILEGDEVIVDLSEMPKGNGQEYGVFQLESGHYFISKFTRFGNQILLLSDDGKIQVIRSERVKVVGKVIGGSFDFEENEKEPVLSA